MPKTKLGVSTGLVAALGFFLALINVFASNSMIFSLPLVILVAYVLYKEEDVWLKAQVLKAALIVIFFIVIRVLFGFVDNVLDFTNFFLAIAKVTKIADGFNIIGFFVNILDVIEKILLLVLGFAALGGKTVRIPVVENILQKNL